MTIAVSADLMNALYEGSKLTYEQRLEELDAVLAASGLSHLKRSEEDTRILTEIMKGVDEKSLYANLRGAAGTGKTVLLMFIVLLLLKDGKNLVVAAPTHKACSVLRKKFEQMGDTVSMPFPNPCTLHSLLRLSPKRSEYGEPEVFVQKGQPYLPSVDLVLIDECSMLGADIMSYIQKDIVQLGIPTLFTGDPYQLRPVGEVKLSSSFKTGHSFTLTEVRRHSGPVLELATHIRKGGSLVGVKPAGTVDSAIFTYRDVKAMNTHWLERLKKEADDTIMLCYTNQKRKAMNDKARAALYGEDAPRFMKGDTLISGSTIEVDEEMIYPNNADISIMIEPELLDTYTPVPGLSATFAAWNLTTESGHDIYVLADRDEEARYKKVLSALGKDIAKQKDALGADPPYQALREVKRRWAAEYFPLKKAFADVDFRYSLTIHKSQGSTYSNVFVATDYKLSGQDIKQLLYVAVTRTSRNLHVVEV